MKTLLTLAALAALTIPAHSNEWRTRDTMSLIENAPDGGYFLLDHDMQDPVHCEITDWPISEPIGLMECSDGENRSIQILNKTTLVVAGYEYYRVD
jgi:hypothetical protein